MKQFRMELENGGTGVESVQKHNIRLGDSLKLIRDLPTQSIDTIVTSPPYWAKRRYNDVGEIGSEDTPEEYVENLTKFFSVLRSFLKDEGNLFVNVGDTFFGSGAGAWNKYVDDEGKVTQTQKDRKEKYYTLKPLQPKIKQNGKLYQNKQLLLIPSRFAVSMQNSGWILRDDIIWHKPNRIPASVKDRFNNTYDHVFHFSKKKKYYFDLDSVKIPTADGRKLKNPGDVWSIKTQPLPGEHTATFPEELVARCIKCSTPENGIVLDPFLGSGTTWIVAHRLERICYGFEIKQEYVEYSYSRFLSSFPDYKMDAFSKKPEAK